MDHQRRQEQGEGEPERYRYDHHELAHSWSPASAHEQGTWESTASFAGKGPKGYKRPDERIHEDVCEALCKDKQVDASEIEVRVQASVVTLKGTIQDRRMKRLAEDCVVAIPGVVDVHNQLEVQSSSHPGAF